MNTNTRRTKSFMQLPLICLFLLSTCSHALILNHEGNDPVPNMGWPTGAEQVANLPDRLGYKEGPPFGGGEYFFIYRCKDTAAFNEALQQFSAIRTPRLTTQSLVSLNGYETRIMNPKPLLLVVHDKAADAQADTKPLSALDNNEQIDWTFTVWIPENHYRSFNHPKSQFTADHPDYRQTVPSPRIDVYTSKDSRIIWNEVNVPSNVFVLDKRAQASPVSLDKGGAIRGSVFDMATHQIITDAAVILMKQNEQFQIEEALRAQTDKNGNFEIRDIPQGYYKLHILADGYADRDMGYFKNNHFSYEEFEVLLSKTVSCKGTVTDTKGNAMAGVEVKASDMIAMNGLGYQCPSDPSTTTDTSGHFELGNLPEGFTHLRCQAPSLHQDTSILELYEVSTRPGSNPEEIIIVMGGTGNVRGKVVNARGNPPKRQFIAEITPEGGNKIGSWGGSMQCKEDGSFEFKNVPLGEYVVTTQPNPMKQGETLPPKPVTIEAGKTIELEFTIEG